MFNTQTSINNIYNEFIKKLNIINNNENLKKNSTDENKKDENLNENLNENDKKDETKKEITENDN